MHHKTGILFPFLLAIIICSNFSVKAVINADTLYYELWQIDTLENIGGHPTTIIGNPQVVSTDLGRAVKFDGDGDMLLIDANPLGDTKEFTVEIIFKPDGNYPQNSDPRFVHIQDPDDAAANRVMMELRITAENLWYLDGYMNTDNADLTLVDESFTHPTEQWMHAAVTYQNGVFKTFVNGIEELSGNVTYASEIVAPNAKTSLGARMDRRNWYSGIIRTFKVSHSVLVPDEFLSIPFNTTQSDEFNDAGLAVYPNPASQFITLTSASPHPPCLVNIINVIGETIYKENWAPSETCSYNINTSHLPEGIYIIEVRSDQHLRTGRLIIMR
jgi:hypothetical protein